MKLVSIVGARPQFVKLAPLCRAIKNASESAAGVGMESIILHTGQHYDYLMSKLFFDQMQIPEPDYNLEVGSGSHAVQTGLMLERIERTLQELLPDIVLVFGDTNSTLAGALAAAKLNIPVAHVEAGLRSYNRQMPEEINRVLADHASTLLFCPTLQAVRNLEAEGFDKVIHNIASDGTYEQFLQKTTTSQPLVIQSGDIMFDAFRYNEAIAEKSSTILQQLGLSKSEYSLLTIHRADSTKDADSLKRILDFVESQGMEGTIVFPVHPRTENLIREKGMKLPDRILMIPPVGYYDMIALEKNASLILTDSGGVQKEAFFARVPCITLRMETEWPETVESGWNRLMSEQPVASRQREMIDSQRYFGDGRSAEVHLKVLVDFCSLKHN